MFKMKLSKTNISIAHPIPNSAQPPIIYSITHLPTIIWLVLSYYQSLITIRALWIVSAAWPFLPTIITSEGLVKAIQQNVSPSFLMLVDNSRFWFSTCQVCMSSNKACMLMFERNFRLSDQIDSEKVTARMDQGILKITLPKKEQAKPKKIEIKLESWILAIKKTACRLIRDAPVMSRLGFLGCHIHKPASPFKFSCGLGQTYGKR